ncbi:MULTISPECIES: Ohr family peroxiredoxin [unclassified Nocardioides]|uniref:Ohr family peroxiredoxin n=1 Tax=unclassified Nocardioides TaxID=2615069 RepID=UPI003014F5B4
MHYTARAHIDGGRDGHAATDTGYPSLTLKPPPAMGGPVDQSAVTNPEQLFALGYGACFLSTLQYVARTRKIRATTFTLDSVVHLVQVDDGFRLSAELTAHLPGVEQPVADELMAEAHAQCVYSRAVRGNIDVTLHCDVTVPAGASA